MDVSVHVVLGPDSGLHHPQQVHAARPQPRAAQVPEPERGAEQNMVMTIFTIFGDGPCNGLLIYEKVLAKILNAVND